MEKTETAAKLPARQLNFTEANGILPEHPQVQLQSKLLALATTLRTQTQTRTEAVGQQLKTPPRTTVTERPKLAAPLMPHMPHPVQPPPSPSTARQVLKTESPQARERCNFEVKDSTPKKQKQCNCKNSQCLKLYCQCFASGNYCDGCNCTNCYNNVEHEAVRKKAIGAVLERNPNAFRPKIATSPQGPNEGGIEAGEFTIAGTHNKGCNCKKSECLKKYCECFQANIVCSQNCKCIDCKNFEGSEDRRALYNGGHTSTGVFYHQRAFAVINGAIGASDFGSTTLIGKGKNQQRMFVMTSDVRLNNGHACQEPFSTSINATSSPSSVVSSGPFTAMTLISKSTYRSLLANVLQPQDVKELCSFLVKISAAAGKTLEGKKYMTSTQEEIDQMITHASLTQESIVNKHVLQESSGNKENRLQTSSHKSDVNGRAMSPETLALMCDERDIILTRDNCSTGISGCDNNATMTSLTGNGLNPVYVEQERLILTRFCSFLNGLIISGSIKGSNCSPPPKGIAENLPAPV